MRGDDALVCFGRQRDRLVAKAIRLDTLLPLQPSVVNHI
jgi:hypothetical protein